MSGWTRYEDGRWVPADQHAPTCKDVENDEPTYRYRAHFLSKCDDVWVDYPSRFFETIEALFEHITRTSNANWLNYEGYGTEFAIGIEEL